MKACSKALWITSSISMDTIHLLAMPWLRAALVLVYPHRRRGCKAVEGADAADAVPGVLCRGGLALAFVALLKAGNEEFLGEGGQHHPAGLAVVHHLIRI